MATVILRRSELGKIDQSARPSRPIARWTAVPDETGRPRLRMAWSVPDVAPAVAVPASRRRSA